VLLFEHDGFRPNPVGGAGHMEWPPRHCGITNVSTLDASVRSVNPLVAGRLRWNP